ncbi:zinc finger protein 706 [Notamacropus eugenii]|uniref:zinc finger protein 706 n=1 Tax=Notamacropus eugenii TaxID=9315 RepID=UPI003B677106
MPSQRTGEGRLCEEPSEAGKPGNELGARAGAPLSLVPVWRLIPGSGPPLPSCPATHQPQPPRRTPFLGTGPHSLRISRLPSRLSSRQPSSPLGTVRRRPQREAGTRELPGDMARGQQKIQSQQKNAKKQAGQKKKQGHDQKAAAKAALIYTCTVCRTQMPDPKTFKQHFESKHPKTPLPPELADVQA